MPDTRISRQLAGTSGHWPVKKLQREKHLLANAVLGATMQSVNPISRGQTRAVLF